MSSVLRMFGFGISPNKRYKDMCEKEVVNNEDRVGEVVRKSILKEGAASLRIKKSVQFSPTVKVSDGSTKTLRTAEQPKSLKVRLRPDPDYLKLFYTKNDYAKSSRELSERAVIDRNLTNLENWWGGQEEPVNGPRAEGRVLFGRKLFKSSDNIDSCLAAAIENASKQQVREEFKDWRTLRKEADSLEELNSLISTQLVQVNQHWNEMYSQEKAESKSNSPAENLSVASNI